MPRFTSNIFFLFPNREAKPKNLINNKGKSMIIHHFMIIMFFIVFVIYYFPISNKRKTTHSSLFPSREAKQRKMINYKNKICDTYTFHYFSLFNFFVTYRDFFYSMYPVVYCFSLLRSSVWKQISIFFLISYVNYCFSLFRFSVWKWVVFRFLMLFVVLSLFIFSIWK